MTPVGGRKAPGSILFEREPTEAVYFLVYGLTGPSFSALHHRENPWRPKIASPPKI